MGFKVRVHVNDGSIGDLDLQENNYVDNEEDPVDSLDDLLDNNRVLYARAFASHYHQYFIKNFFELFEMKFHEILEMKDLSYMSVLYNSILEKYLYCAEYGDICDEFVFRFTQKYREEFVKNTEALLRAGGKFDFGHPDKVKLFHWFCDKTHLDTKSISEESAINHVKHFHV